MKKNIFLVFVMSIVMSSDVLSADPEYQGNSTVYTTYDATVNGVKGAIFATMVTPVTLGVYIPYSYCAFADVMLKRSILAGSSAAHFGVQTRQEVERETALREITNRSAKAAIGTAYVLIAIVARHRIMDLAQSLISTVRSRS